MKKTTLFSIVLATLGFHSAALAGENLDLCHNVPVEIETYKSELRHGPFFRPNGDEVGEIDLGIRRYGFTDGEYYGAACSVGNVEIRYKFRELRLLGKQFVTFQIIDRSIKGFILFRDRDGNSILKIYRPTSETRQQSIKVLYNGEQDLSEMISDILYLATAWEGTIDGE